MLILIVAILLLGAAVYAGYTWFGQLGLAAALVPGLAILTALWALGGLQVS